MRKQIVVDNQLVTYIIKKSKRARNIRISVNVDSRVVVTMPFYVREKVAERFVKEKGKWIIAKIEHFKKFSSNKPVKFDKKDYAKYKEVARKLVTDRVEHFNETYNFKYNRISIRNQKTRWGSCSSKGNLNFNYKLVHLPLRLTDYIVVHELCHLKEMNHSKNFWEQVSVFFPDYKELKKALRKLSISLR